MIRPRGLADSPEAPWTRSRGRSARPGGPVDPGRRLRPRDRHDAPAAFDDPLVFERDAIPAVIPVFAAGPPTIAVSRPVGARRHHLETAGAEPVALELTRLADGWVVSEVGPIAPSTDPPASPP
ncbi:MAG: hypothetical protein R3B09_04550 [Nannocystaceae bacterium]